MLKKILTLVIIFIFINSPVLASSCAPNGKAKAFPTAEGYGAMTTGGRGGKVFIVTNLNDSGPGSLRECVEANETRTCVFNVSGIIKLDNALRVNNPNITIAGQTAPVHGITLTGGGNFSPLYIRTDNVVVRFVKSRPVPKTSPANEVRSVSIGKYQSSLDGVIIDHMSGSWSVDEVINAWYGSRNISIQHSIWSYGLNNSVHSKGAHSKGPFFGDNRGGNISFHHNYLAHNLDRNPGLRTGSGPVQVTNNLIYNWAAGLKTGAYGGATVEVDAIGNYFARSVSNTYQWNETYEIRFDVFPDGAGSTKAFVAGNLGLNRTSPSEPEENLVHPSSRDKLVSQPLAKPTIPVTIDNVEVVKNDLLAEVGDNGWVDCEGNWNPHLDEIDQQAMDDYWSKTGTFIDAPSQLGGLPNYPQIQSVCSDRDTDGMPDAFEDKYGVDDVNGDEDGDGYTNIEEYLNSTIPNVPETGCNGTSITPTPTLEPTNQPTPHPSIDLSFDHTGDGIVDIRDILELVKYIFR